MNKILTSEINKIKKYINHINQRTSGDFIDLLYEYINLIFSQENNIDPKLQAQKSVLLAEFNAQLANNNQKKFVKPV